MWELVIEQKEKGPFYFEHKVKFAASDVDLLIDIIVRLKDLETKYETKFIINKMNEEASVSVNE